MLPEFTINETRIFDSQRTPTLRSNENLRCVSVSYRTCALGDLPIKRHQMLIVGINERRNN